MNVRQWQAWTRWNVWLPTAFVVVVVAGAALLIGAALAEEQWGILALPIAVAAAPIVIRWPVISTFGLYAFLVPFDAVAVVGGGTLTKLLGMVTAVVLLTAALMERRLLRPPGAALWWALFLLWAAMSLAWTDISPAVLISLSQTP